MLILGDNRMVRGQPGKLMRRKALRVRVACHPLEQMLDGNTSLLKTRMWVRIPLPTLEVDYVALG